RVDRGLAEARTDRPLLGDLDGQGQRTALDERRELGRLLLREATRDRRRATRDAHVARDVRADLGRRDDLVVEHDRDTSLRVTEGAARGLARDPLPLGATRLPEVDL